MELKRRGGDGHGHGAIMRAGCRSPRLWVFSLVVPNPDSAAHPMAKAMLIVIGLGPWGTQRKTKKNKKKKDFFYKRRHRHGRGLRAQSRLNESGLT